MKQRTEQTYRALIAYGFSAYKALEIVIDAQRGDRHALMVVEVVTDMQAKADAVVEAILANAR